MPALETGLTCFETEAIEANAQLSALQEQVAAREAAKADLVANAPQVAVPPR